MTKIISLLLTYTILIHSSFSSTLQQTLQMQINRIENFEFNDTDDRFFFSETLSLFIQEWQSLENQSQNSDPLFNFFQYLKDLKVLKKVAQGPKNSLQDLQLTRDTFVKKYKKNDEDHQSFWDYILYFFENPEVIFFSLLVASGFILTFGDTQNAEDTPKNFTFENLEHSKWSIELIQEYIKKNQFKELTYQIDKLGRTALMWLCSQDHFVLYEDKIKDFDFEHREKLYNQYMRNALDAMEKILESRYMTPRALNKGDNSEITALIIASWNGYTPIVKLLLNNKNMTIEVIKKEDDFGDTARSWAYKKHFHEIVFLIDEKLKSLEK